MTKRGEREQGNRSWCHGYFFNSYVSTFINNPVNGRGRTKDWGS